MGRRAAGFVAVLALTAGGASPVVAQGSGVPTGAWKLGTAPPGQAPVYRHEPIFGVGPRTIWQNGWGIEVELESQGDELVLPVEVMYGVTEELTVTAVLPWAEPADGGRLGDVGMRAKWRFATRFARGLSDAVALLGGVTFPRTAVDAAPKGGPIAMLGMAAGRESRRWYYFAGARGMLRLADDGLDPGDRLALNLAWGIRPRRTEYLAPDLVLLLELNGRVEGRTRTNGTVVGASGGRSLSVAPAFLLSLRNVMLKGGIDMPVWKDLNDPVRTLDARLVAALEVHW
jgi:hypothetical protein